MPVTGAPRKYERDHGWIPAVEIDEPQQSGPRQDAPWIQSPRGTAATTEASATEA